MVTAKNDSKVVTRNSSQFQVISTKSAKHDDKEVEPKVPRLSNLQEQKTLQQRPKRNKAVLTVSPNKKQLMSIICNNIINDEAFHIQHTMGKKLVIIGSDAKMSQPRSTKGLSLQGKTLQHLTKKQITSLYNKLSCVEKTSNLQRSLIDIKTTVQAHRTIIPGLQAAHAVSGGDTVPTYFGIGKGTVLKNLIAAPNSLSLLGCSDAPLPDVVDQATKFISACYSKTVHEKTMSDVRYKIWTTKFGNTATSVPKIQALPPITEAFVENVKRAHPQTVIWKAALTLDPPTLDPVEYGYVRHEPSKSLLPTTVPDGVTLAPDDIMSLIKCNCE
ncbi:Hypothetical predicted protein, partial [Paramuricea clavata]